MASKKKLPDALVSTRPALDLDDFAQHPSNGVPVGPVPRQYSRALHDAICANIRAGNRPHVAAQMAGVTAQTFHQWMRTGKEGDPHLWEFAQDVELAEGDAEGTALAVITKAFADDPDNAKWFLERGRGAGWSKEVNTRVEAAIGEFMQRLREGLTELEWRKVVAVSTGESMLELEGPGRFKLAAPREVIEDAETEES